VITWICCRDYRANLKVAPARKLVEIHQTKTPGNRPGFCRDNLGLLSRL
jgi:hypothetical protein